MRVASWLLVAAGLIAARPAAAWVCSRALDSDRGETGPSLSWFTRDLTFALHADGTNDLPGDNENAVLEAAFQVWVGVSACTSGSMSTTDITFTRDPEPVTRDLVGFDFLEPDINENLLIFRDQDWPHQSRVIALTTTTYSAQTGEIFDADIEFNSMDFDFDDLAACCPNCNGNPGDDPDFDCRATDLSNTAVHEIGHVLGLGHPDSWSALDPTCATGATMCSTAELGDTDKRSLACDDRNAIVFKYPAGQANQYCDQPACAETLEACGTCDATACEAWSGCGYCAPPIPLTNGVTVTAIGFNDGMGEGCSCGAAPVSGLLLAAGLLLGRRRRR